MPELPEVEHARRLLARWLRGATLDDAVVLDARILDGDTTPAQIVRALRGRRVRGVDRRGKWLRIRLDSGLLFSHLGMTGRWVESEGAPPRAAKVALSVSRRGCVRTVTYVDPRMFGRFVVASADLDAWSSLGPDPIHDGINESALHAKLATRRGPIKPALLDQTLLAGVGNIQATEGLYSARIDPRRASRTLDRREVGALARGLLRTLRATLADQARDDALRYFGDGGDVANPFQIYGRAGEPCPRCGATLSRIEQAARSTVFCPRCQI